jgi:hypothetical protein
MKYCYDISFITFCTIVVTHLSFKLNTLLSFLLTIFYYFFNKKEGNSIDGNIV